MLRVINQNVVDFVCRAENRALKPGTGIYSNHFRGGYQGEYTTDAVWKKVSERGRIDVLWLGANPNVPDSLDRILAGAGNEHFDLYLDRVRQGWHCEIHFEEGGRRLWDPLSNVTQSGWRFYKDALGQVADTDSMIFANIVPWGSSNVNALIDGIGELDPELLKRVFEFGGSQVRAMAKLLKPRYIIAPRSFCEHKALRKAVDSPILGGRSYNFENRSIKPGRRAMHFRFRADTDLGATIVHAAHPSSLRVTGAYRQAYFDHFSQLLYEYAL